jgi:hypothetical protein
LIHAKPHYSEVVYRRSTQSGLYYRSERFGVFDAKTKGKRVPNEGNDVSPLGRWGNELALAPKARGIGAVLNWSAEYPRGIVPPSDYGIGYEGAAPAWAGVFSYVRARKWAQFRNEMQGGFGGSDKNNHYRGRDDKGPHSLQKCG